MAGRDVISQIVNEQAVNAELKDLIDQLKQVDTLIRNMPQIMSAYKNSSGIADFKKNNDQVVESNKQMVQMEQQLQKEIEKRTALESDLGKKLMVQKELNIQRTKDLKTEAQATAGLTDAYKQLSLQYNASARNAKNLAIQYGENSKQAKDAAASANALAERLKMIDASVGQHQRKVGDYVGAVSILSKQLEDVKGKMNQFTQSGNTNSTQFQQLEKEYGLLTSIVNQQSKGFSSLTMELRNNERALASMSEAGLAGSEGFKQLQTSVADAQRQLNEFTKSQKILESETPVLQGMIAAAKGLGGMYATGAGAAALFADGNEKVQKELNKLVAVMTLLQGLQQLSITLQERGAIVTAINAGWTKALAAAQWLYAAATTGATVAMTAFETVLISTGIGAFLVLIGTTAAAMSKMGDATEKEVEQIHDLTRAVEEAGEAFTAMEQGINDVFDLFEERIKASGAKQSEIDKADLDRIKQLIDAKQSQVDSDNKAYDNAMKNTKLSADDFKKIADAQATSATDLTRLKTEQILKQIDLGKDEVDEQKQAAEDAKRLWQEQNKATAAELDEQMANEEALSRTKIQLRDVDLADEARYLKQTADNTKNGFEIRLKALNDYYSLQGQISSDEASIEIGTLSGTLVRISEIEKLSGAQRTEEEKKLLAQKEVIENQKVLAVEKSNVAQVDLSREAALQLATLQQQELDKLFKEGADSDKGSADKLEISLLENKIKLYGDLNQRYRDGKIALAEYNEEKVKLDKGSEIATIQTQIYAVQDLISTYEKAGKDTAELVKQMITLNASLQGVESASWEQPMEKAEAESKKLETQAYETGKQIQSTIFSFMNDQVTYQENLIQKQINHIDLYKQADIDRINKSTEAEQDKANKIAIINAKSEADKEVLQLKQRKLEYEKAQYGKAASILSIIEDTARGVMGASPDIPMMVLIGAMGAAQLAHVAAQPIPHYAEGTGPMGHPGGLALAGEAGPEMIVTPSGSLRVVSKATVMDMPRGTHVIPTAEVDKLLYNIMIGNSAKSLDRLESSELSGKIEDLKQTMIWQTREMQRMFEGNRSRTIVNVKNDASFLAHIKKQVYE
jgi:hypothetical protein